MSDDDECSTCAGLRDAIERMREELADDAVSLTRCIAARAAVVEERDRLVDKLADVEARGLALCPEDVVEVHEAEARGVACRTDDTRCQIDMWAAAQEQAADGTGRVVACSEWG